MVTLFSFSPCKSSVFLPVSWWSFNKTWVTARLLRTLLSILADLNDAVVWMVSILPQISSHTNLFSKPLGDHSQATNHNWYPYYYYYHQMNIVTWNKVFGRPCGILTKMLDWGLKISEFELQSRYYVDFQTNTSRKSMTHLSSHK